jgi:hypothetical protein
MGRRIWLINLFGIPCTPSAFNPDNSLAAIAGSLKAAGHFPRIIDFQNVDFSERLMPPEIGGELMALVSSTEGSALTTSEVAKFSELHKRLLGHQLEILRVLADDLCLKARHDNPLFIGFKLYSGEGALFSRILAQRLRSDLKIPIVGGGPLIRVIGSDFLKLYDEFDFVLDGEADRSIVQFAKFLEGETEASSIRGLAFKSANGTVIRNPVDIIESLEDLADPAYDEDVYPILYKENQKALVFQLDESRGCPNQCHFCVHPIINERKFRVVPPQKIVRQIEGLQSRFGARAFRFTGSNTPKNFLKDFGKMVLEKNLDIIYSCYASVNTTPPESLRELKKTGLSGIFVGAEGVDSETLKSVFNKKGQTADKIEGLLKACFENEVYATSSWIYPTPRSTAKIRDEMKDFILRVYKGQSLDQGSVMVVPAVLLPQTHWFSNRSEFGFELKSPVDFLRGYAELNLRFWLPRALMNDLHFTLEGRNFLELAAECDVLNNQLIQHGVPTGITDDWMLQGKLSGMKMKDYKAAMIKSFLSGDYRAVRSIIAKINSPKDQKKIRPSEPPSIQNSV